MVSVAAVFCRQTATGPDLAVLCTLHRVARRGWWTVGGHARIGTDVVDIGVGVGVDGSSRGRCRGCAQDGRWRCVHHHLVRAPAINKVAA